MCYFVNGRGYLQLVFETNVGPLKSSDSITAVPYVFSAKILLLFGSFLSRPELDKDRIVRKRNLMLYAQFS